MSKKRANIKINGENRVAVIDEENNIYTSNSLDEPVDIEEVEEIKIFENE